MKGKRIINIVFFKVNIDEEHEEKRAAIFYADGTAIEATFDEGISACEIVCRENNIKTKDAFKEMINKNIVHVMSAEEFQERVDSFFADENALESEETYASEREADPINVQQDEEITADDFVERNQSIPVVAEIEEQVEEDERDNQPVKQETEASSAKEAAKNTSVVNVVPVNTGDKKEPEKKEQTTTTQNDSKKESKKESVIPVAAAAAVGAGAAAKMAEKAGEKKSTSEKKIETPVTPAETEETKDKKKKGVWANLKSKIKNNKLIKRIMVCVTALAVGLGLYSCHNKKTIEGQMLNSNISTETNIDKDDFRKQNIIIHRLNNDMYDQYGYNDLLEVTHNKFQRTAMTNIRDGLIEFNDIFARNYEENGVRPALKWDEMVALQTAYNNYNKEQIQAYFNGAEIHAEDLSRAYKDASLQLMGAYTIESRRHPVDISMIIESEKGKEFYNRYHDAFLKCKETTGEDQLERVRNFYSMVRSDFPISEKERTEGISHAQNYEMLESYKLSVVPMIAAAEMMFQNLATDVTLNDQEVEFFNDLGLCNFADKTFERISAITLLSKEDNFNPLYEQFRAAMIEILTKNKMYYVDDAARELTKLEAFQDAVNGNFDKNVPTKNPGYGYTPQKPSVNVTTEQQTTTTTETTTTYETVETRTEKPIPPEVKAQIDAQIDAENEQARKEAERLAEQERQRLQEIEDRRAQQIQQEVIQDEKDMQQKITNINSIINQNNKDQDKSNDRVINERDFGDHGVKFDDQHQDGKGNLNDSVENITTDPTGDMTNQPLPDPNQTGAAFDRQAPGLPITTQQAPQVQQNVQEPVQDSNYTSVEESNNGWVESTPVEDGYYFEDSWVEYGAAPQNANERAVDEYVESLVNDGQQDETPYQYNK